MILSEQLLVNKLWGIQRLGLLDVLRGRLAKEALDVIVAHAERGISFKRKEERRKMKIRRRERRGKKKNKDKIITDHE